MLILTRKPEQGIVINDDTIVRVLTIEGDRVKLGITAPRSVTILREELLEEVAGQNRRAARPPDAARLVSRLRGAQRPAGPASGRATGPTDK